MLDKLNKKVEVLPSMITIMSQSKNAFVLMYRSLSSVKHIASCCSSCHCRLVRSNKSEYMVIFLSPCGNLVLRWWRSEPGTGSSSHMDSGLPYIESNAFLYFLCHYNSEGNIVPHFNYLTALSTSCFTKIFAYKTKMSPLPKN